MPGKIDPSVAKAWAFFERAQKAAQTNNFDYAIDMYLEGLRQAPDALEQGHHKLYSMALQRQRRGGKKPSMMEKVKRLKPKKEHLEQMLDAEYLLAKDPEHLPYAEAVLKAALAGGYNKTAKWLADLAFQINNSAGKPSLHTYLLLKDAYVAINQYDRAAAACQQAVRLKPNDAALAKEFQRLTAELTLAKGKYDEEGDFRKAIKDREVQEKLHAQESVVKTEDYRLSAVKEAEKNLAQNPNLPKNIFNLASVLADMQDENYENQAIELLEKSYREKNDFSYKQRSDQILIQQLKRNLRKAKTALEAKPDDPQAKSTVGQLSNKLKDTELEHYRLCVENYPTDLQAKFEYAVRLVKNNQYDDAIPLFQEAQKDPRHKIAAMSKIGLCFFKKGWFADAVDIFTQAMDSHEIKDDALAKELRYNLARSYEEQKDTQKALEIYRKIAQLDFGYKDVRQRVDKLRQEQG